MPQTVICPTCNHYVAVADPPTSAPAGAVGWFVVLFFMLLVNLALTIYLARGLYAVTQLF